MMNEPCFSVCSFPSFLYSRRFRNEVSNDVIIMGFPINKSPPPLWGRARVGGRSARPWKEQSPSIGSRHSTPHLDPPPQGGGDQKFGRRRLRPLGEAKSTNSRCPLIHVQTAVFISSGSGWEFAGKAGGSTQSGHALLGVRAVVEAQSVGDRGSFRGCLSPADGFRTMNVGARAFFGGCLASLLVLVLVLGGGHVDRAERGRAGAGRRRGGVRRGLSVVGTRATAACRGGRVAVKEHAYACIWRHALDRCRIAGNSGQIGRGDVGVFDYLNQVVERLVEQGAWYTIKRGVEVSLRLAVEPPDAIAFASSLIAVCVPVGLAPEPFPDDRIASIA